MLNTINEEWLIINVVTTEIDIDTFMLYHVLYHIYYTL